MTPTALGQSEESQQGEGMTGSFRVSEILRFRGNIAVSLCEDPPAARMLKDRLEFPQEELRHL